MKLARPPSIEVIAASVAQTAAATQQVAEATHPARPPGQTLPVWALGASSLTSAEQLRVFSGLLSTTSAVVPASSGGEAVADLATALTDQPHDPLVAAGYTVGILIAAAGRAIGEQSGTRWLELIGCGAGAAIGGASSALKGDVIGAVSAFLEVVADAADLEEVVSSDVGQPRVPVLCDRARTEGALRALADVAHRDPRSLDPLIECAAKQLSTLESAPRHRPILRTQMG